MDGLQGKLLDKTGWDILQALQKDGRISYRELGKEVGLSTPAVSERVRKLEENGIIRGYQAVLDLERLGRPITAFTSVKTNPEKNPNLIKFVEESPAVLEAHYITGDASFLLKIAVASIKEMEQLIQSISHYGATSTSIVMSTYAEGKTLRPD